jgi:hypothetical protein
MKKFIEQSLISIKEGQVISMQNDLSLIYLEK